MDFRFFLQGIEKAVFKPAEFWETIRREKTSSSLIRNSILIPLAVLVALFGFAGSIIFTNNHLAPVYSVLYSIQCFMVILISVYIASGVLVIGAGLTGVSVPFGLAFRLFVISLIPFLLCQILSKLFESFQFVNILALFGLNVFWIGSEKLINVSEKQKLTLLITAFAAFFLIFIISDLVLGLISDKIYFGIFA